MNPGQTIQALRDTGHELKIRVKGDGAVHVLLNDDKELLAIGLNQSISVALHQCLIHYRSLKGEELKDKVKENDDVEAD